MFRPIDGLRTPCLIVLNRQRDVIFDGVDEEALAQIKASPHRLARHRLEPAAMDPKTAVEQAGLQRHVTEKGILLSREPLDEWGQKFEAWLDSSKPSPFRDPESERLRIAYFEEKVDTELRIAAGNCPGCELNRLQVEYRLKLRKAQGL